MALPTPNELKKLAKACRAAGNVQFECEGLKFTLTDYVPVKGKRSKAATRESLNSSSIKNFDDMDPDSLLFWSSADADFNEKKAG